MAKPLENKLHTPTVWSYATLRQKAAGRLALAAAAVCSGENLLTNIYRYIDRQINRDRFTENNGCLAVVANTLYIYTKVGLQLLQYLDDREYIIHKYDLYSQMLHFSAVHSSRSRHTAQGDQYISTNGDWAAKVNDQQTVNALIFSAVGRMDVVSLTSRDAISTNRVCAF